MSKIKANIYNALPFTQTPNTTARDKRLSLEARGTLTYLLSHSETFKFTIKFLLDEFGIGKHKLYRIIAELKKFGYLNIVHLQNAEGKFEGCDWDIYGLSQEINFQLNHTAEKPLSEKTGVRLNGSSENRDDIKKKSSKEEKLREEEKEIHLSETDASAKNPTQQKVASPKPKKADKPTNPLLDNPEFREFRARLWEFQKGYSPVPDRERIIAINNCLPKLFAASGGDADICERIHGFLQTDWADRKIPVLWTEVFKNFDFNKKRALGLANGANNEQIQRNNGNGYKTTADKRAERAINDFNAIQEVRNRVNERRRNEIS